MLVHWEAVPAKTEKGEVAGSTPGGGRGIELDWRKVRRVKSAI